MKVFRKTGVSTLINILGMSVAFAAAMILMVQVKWDSTYDKNFEGHEKVFRMENTWMGTGTFDSYFSRPLIESIRSASPNIEAVGTVWVSGGDIIFHREGDRQSAITIPTAFADSTMFSVFPFEWEEGSARDFTAKGTVVLNKAFADMIFGSESAVGKILETGDGAQCRIVGVFKNTPRNYSMHYGLVKNLGNQSLTDPQEWSYFSYVKLKDPSQVHETESAILDVVLEGNDDESMVEQYRKGFRLSNLHDVHYERDVVASEVAASKPITITLASIAALLILIAIINFINFSFAGIPFRIKNINTRKVLGEGRGSLIRRQLVGAGTTAIAAFVIACLIMHAVAGTSIASYVSDSIALKDNFGILALTFGITLVSAVVAGLAPALYSTSQPTAMVLKGSYGTSVKGRSLRNILVALQFILSLVFIMTALFVSVQTKYMEKKDMGFNEARVLQIWCGQVAGGQKDALKDKLLQNPAIEAVTFSDNLLVSDQKMGWGRQGEDGKSIYMEVLPVDDNFVDFFGLKILDGRDFLKSDNLGDAGCFIVNETFAHNYPQYHIGSLMGGHSGDAEIVGIVKDFNFKSLQHPMSSLVLYNWGKSPWRPFSIVYVRMMPGADFKEVSQYIREAVCAFDSAREPDQVNVRHLDEWIGAMYQKEQSLGKLITIASIVALLIALIGIIGLVFLETQFLRKEIAVRRVNGATVESILAMINRKYLILTCVSFAVAAPLAYWLIISWRKGFAYQAPVPLWLFAAALLFVAAITIAVVTLQSWKAANANPVDSLKNE